MPDKDRETRYFNKKTSNLEWRYRYCPKVYDLYGGSTIISNHLTGPVLKHGHELSRESVRDVKARNQQLAIQEAMNQAAANPHKRRQVGDGEGTSIEPNMLKILC